MNDFRTTRSAGGAHSSKSEPNCRVGPMPKLSELRINHVTIPCQTAVSLKSGPTEADSRPSRIPLGQQSRFEVSCAKTVCWTSFVARSPASLPRA